MSTFFNGENSPDRLVFHMFHDNKKVDITKIRYGVLLLVLMPSNRVKMIRLIKMSMIDIYSFKNNKRNKTETKINKITKTLIYTKIQMMKVKVKFKCYNED